MFEGSIPQLYEKYLVPMIFEPYANDLASRVKSGKSDRVLEVAAGTGAAGITHSAVSVMSWSTTARMSPVRSNVSSCRSAVDPSLRMR